MNQRPDNAFLRAVRNLGHGARQAARRRVRWALGVRGIEGLEERCLLSSTVEVNSAGVLVINANDGTGTNTIVLNEDPTNPALIDVSVDNTTYTPYNATTLDQPEIQVSTTVPAGVATDNQLELSLGTYASETYSATAGGAGTIVLAPAIGPELSGNSVGPAVALTVNLTINYTGIDAVFDASTAPTGKFTDAIASDTALTVGNGTATGVDGAEGYAVDPGAHLVPSGGTPVSPGRQVTQALVEVADKTNLTIDAGSDASVVLNSTFAADEERQQTILTEASGGLVTLMAAGENTTISTNAPVSNTVTVGGPTVLLNLQGSVTLTNVVGSATTLVVDESAIPNATDINLTDTEVALVVPPSGGLNLGTTVADIHYTTAGVKTLTINGSSDGDTVLVTTTGSQTSTILNTGSGNDTVTIDNAPGPLTVHTGTGTNVVHVVLAGANTYNLSVNGGGPAQDNTLDVHDTTRAPILSSTTSGPDAGAVRVSYKLGSQPSGRGILVPTYRTYFIPYTDVANLQLLPDAEHSLVQALYQEILQQTGTTAQLDTSVALLQKTGKIQSVVTALENSPVGRKLAKHRPKVVLNQLPDFAAVEAELAASRPTKKHR